MPFTYPAYDSETSSPSPSPPPISTSPPLLQETTIAVPPFIPNRRTETPSTQRRITRNSNNPTANRTPQATRSFAVVVNNNDRSSTNPADPSAPDNHPRPNRANEPLTYRERLQAEHLEAAKRQLNSFTASLIVYEAGIVDYTHLTALAPVTGLLTPLRRVWLSLEDLRQSIDMLEDSVEQRRRVRVDNSPSNVVDGGGTSPAEGGIRTFGSITPR